MLYKLLVIAKNTFTETLRQPVYTVIIVSALLMLFISPSITMYSMDEDIKLLREIGLSTLFLSGLFIAVFAASGAITEEIETKTITTVLSKPITRPVFIFGKFLGITAAVTLAHYICTIALIMTIRHGVLEVATDTHDWPVIAAAAVATAAILLLTAFANYTYDWPFTSTGIITTAIFATFALAFLCLIDRDWQFKPQNNNIAMFEVYASVLLLMAVIILVALAVTFSCRFNVVLTLTCCVAIFLLGLISDWLFGRFADQNLLAKIAWIIVPNLQVFWISDSIYEGCVVPPGYIALSASYGVFYTLGILFLGIAVFQKRQIG